MIELAYSNPEDTPPYELRPEHDGKRLKYMAQW